MIKFEHGYQIILSTYSSISAPRQPQCPPSSMGLRMRDMRVLGGVVSLKGQMKSVIFLKWGPRLMSSLATSSRQMMSPPMCCSTSSLVLMGTRSVPTFPYIFLQMSSLTTLLDGSPYVMQFQTRCSRRRLAADPFSRTAEFTPRRLSRLRISFWAGEMSWTPRILIARMSFLKPSVLFVILECATLPDLRFRQEQDFWEALYCFTNFSGALMASLFLARFALRASLLLILLSMASWSFFLLFMMSSSTYFFSASGSIVDEQFIILDCNSGQQYQQKSDVHADVKYFQLFDEFPSFAGFYEIVTHIDVLQGHTRIPHAESMHGLHTELCQEIICQHQCLYCFLFAQPVQKTVELVIAHVHFYEPNHMDATPPLQRSQVALQVALDQILVDELADLVGDGSLELQLHQVLHHALLPVGFVQNRLALFRCYSHVGLECRLLVQQLAHLDSVLIQGGLVLACRHH